jgi:hypothetical protein
MMLNSDSAAGRPFTKGAGEHFHKGQRVPVKADQIQFALLPCRLTIPSDEHVSLPYQ